MADPSPSRGYLIQANVVEYEPPKELWVDIRIVRLLNAIIRNRNAGCRYGLIDYKTLQIGSIIEMEKGGS